MTTSVTDTAVSPASEVPAGRSGLVSKAVRRPRALTPGGDAAARRTAGSTRRVDERVHGVGLAVGFAQKAEGPVQGENRPFPQAASRRTRSARILPRARRNTVYLAAKREVRRLRRV